MIEQIKNPYEQEDSEESPISLESPKVKEPILPRIVSFILHPLFMVIFAVMLIFIYTDFKFIFANQFLRFMAPVIFLSCIIPASGIYFLNVAKIITDYQINEKNEWFLPFTVFLLSYGLLFSYFLSAKLFMWFLSVLAIPIILLLIYTIVSRFWKISAHMIGIGGLIGCILSVCYHVKGLNPYVLFIILFILAGCLGVSRLILKRSNPSQVYVGFLVGLVVSYLCVWIGAYWGFVIFMRNL